MSAIRAERAYPTRPFVAVGAVVVEDGEVLLIRRMKPPRMGDWSIPGGIIETGETIETALKREVREETGLLVEPVRWLKNIDSLTEDSDGKPLYHYVLLDYLARVKGGTLKSGDDALEAVFFPLDAAIDKVSWHETKTLLREVKAHLESHDAG